MNRKERVELQRNAENARKEKEQIAEQLKKKPQRVLLTREELEITEMNIRLGLQC